MAGRLPFLGRLGQKYLRLYSEKIVITRLQQCRCLHPSYHLSAVTNLKMPALSPTMEEGTIIKWHKKEGDVINPGDSLCEIQTDKAVLTLDVEEECILAKILRPDNSKNVRVGSLIALLVDEGEDWENVEVPATEDAVEVPATEDAVSAPAAAAGAGTGSETRSPGTAPLTKTGPMMGYGPAVRALLNIYNISMDTVQGTGPHGRLLKGDLLRYISDKMLKPATGGQVIMSPAETQPTAMTADAVSVPTTQSPVAGPAPTPFKSSSYTDRDLTNIRKIIAKRLTESKATIPHSYATVDCRIDSVLALRKEIMADGIKVSMNDFIVKAAAVALQQVPGVNANMAGDTVRLLDTVDIAVAVATPNGLITPIIKDAIGLGVQDISRHMKELAVRAREGKLKPHEFLGGSFTISNLGMFGITEFSAVINPPQVCILAVGTARPRPDPAQAARPDTCISVTLSADARVVDDLLAAQFLAAFRETLETPMLMLGSGGPKDLHIGEGKEKLVVNKANLFAS